MSRKESQIVCDYMQNAIAEIEKAKVLLKQSTNKLPKSDFSAIDNNYSSLIAMCDIQLAITKLQISIHGSAMR